MAASFEVCRIVEDTRARFPAWRMFLAEALLFLMMVHPELVKRRWGHHVSMMVCTMPGLRMYV